MFMCTWQGFEKIFFLYGLRRNIYEILTVEEIDNFKENFYPFVQARFADVIKEIIDVKTLTKDLMGKMDTCLVSFFQN